MLSFLTETSEITFSSFFFFLNAQRILGSNHQFYNTTQRRPIPLGNLIRKIFKRCPVSKGEQEKYCVHLLLTGLEDKRESDVTKLLV